MRIKMACYILLGAVMLGSGVTVSAEDLDGGALYSNPAKGGCTAVSYTHLTLPTS